MDRPRLEVGDVFRCYGEAYRQQHAGSLSRNQLRVMSAIEHAADLWPAALGSLSLRRTRCIRKDCSACQSGEKHPSWVLSGHVQNQRFSLYVPEALVPQVQRCLENGRALQELLYASAPRYIKALKRTIFASKS